jgi:hypothetical protein
MEAAGFNVLACELASRSAQQYHPLNWGIRRFLGTGYSSTDAEIEGAAKEKCLQLQIANVEAVNQRYGEAAKPEPQISGALPLIITQAGPIFSCSCT